MSLLSISSFAAEVAPQGNTTSVNRTKTLLETVASSLKDQSLSQYAYYVTVGASQIKTNVEDVNQPTANLGIRVWKNIWVEGSFGQNLRTDFPGNGIDTKITRYSGKLRYNIEATSYFHIQPYVGYFTTRANSPGAGYNAPDGTLPAEEMDLEETMLNELRNDGVSYGGSMILKYNRVALKTDIGNDALGISIGAFF